MRLYRRQFPACGSKMRDNDNPPVLRLDWLRKGAKRLAQVGQPSSIDDRKTYQVLQINTTRSRQWEQTF